MINVRLVRMSFLASACIASLGLAAGDSPAGAAVTIGQLAPGNPPTGTCGAGPNDSFNPTAGGNSYVIPGVGTITSWSTSAAAGAGQMFEMKIFRKVADPMTYKVVAHNGPQPLNPGAVNSFPVNIPVQAGDVLGINDANASTVNNACEYSATGATMLTLFGDLNDGQSGAFNNDASNFQKNVAATFEPRRSNVFTFGATTRNKKKGTATLNLNLPNPGELTGSGNGANVASMRAVISKSVPAGTAQLLIKATGKKRKKLNATGKVKLSIAVTYTPTFGDANTQTTAVKLKKKL